MQTARGVKPTPIPPVPQPKGTGRGRLLGMDLWMLALVFAMIAFGLVMVYSASWDVSFRLHGDANALFRRQLGNLVIGLLAMGLTAWMPIRWLRRLAVPILGVSMLALLLVLMVNSGDGPRRAILGGSVQPSDMAKLAIFIYLAVWMETKGIRL
jgi:cell division protein FtsW